MEIAVIPSAAGKMGYLRELHESGIDGERLCL
jgi:hypothetical protein